MIYYVFTGCLHFYPFLPLDTILNDLGSSPSYSIDFFDPVYTYRMDKIILYIYQYSR